MNDRSRAWGWSWIGLVVAFMIHVADEIASDAPSFYNPFLREVAGWELRWDVWLIVLSALVIALASLTVFLFRGVKALRYPVYATATLMILNSLQHVALLVALRRITPGTRSAPLLLAASVWVLRETRRVFARG